jgi:hypothetical protein
MTAHGRVTQGGIPAWLGAERHPVTTTSTRYDDRIPTVLLKDFEHICRSEHSYLQGTASLPLIQLSGNPYPVYGMVRFVKATTSPAPNWVLRTALGLASLARQ